MIYISYSQKDKSIVQRICQKLKDNGVQLYVDSKQLAGGDFAEEITKGIAKAEAILFFYSDNTENSTWVRHEIEFAISQKKTIIPVLLNESEPGEWLIYNLREVSWIKQDGDDPDHLTDDILKALDAIQMWDEASLDPGCDGESLIEVDSIEYAPTKPSPRRKPSPKRKPSPNRSFSFRPWAKAIVFSCLIILVLYIVYVVINLPRSNSIKPDDLNFSEFITIQDIWLQLLLSFLAGVGIMALLLWPSKKRRDNVKLSSNIASIISIDGDVQKEIMSREVYSTHLDKGEYLIDFEDINNDERHKVFNHTVDTNDSKLIFAEFESQSSDREKSIKCFIAGSKTLQTERDALRAVTCVMYNKWAAKSFRILSYTFEDFERAAVIGGHQKQYNDFIANEADWALFVINGRIGSITIEEYRVAMDSYKKNGRPRILAFAKTESEDNEDIATMKAEINKEHQYWTDYSDINSLKLLFESTLNWDLINIFQK